MKHVHDGQNCYGMSFGCYIGLKERLERGELALGDLSVI